MKTRILRINPKKIDRKKIIVAAKVLCGGGLVAFPTETVYGLGANALDSRAVKKIFRAKGRPFDDPLIVHVCSEEQVYALAKKVTLNAKLLVEKFWPGPLTIVLKKSKIVPRITTGGLDTVAVRMPSHKIAQKFLCSACVPVAAPSANLFGKPSPTSAEHVREDLDGKIDVIIDGGKAKIGVESTVIDLSGKMPVLLRPGGVSLEQLEKTIGKIIVHPLVRKKVGSKKQAARSPGMKYRHYAPRAEVVLVEGTGKKVLEKIKKIKAGLAGKKIFVLWTRGRNMEKVAAGLFSEFRQADKKGADVIIVEGVEEKGIGLAVMNRIRKAAGSIIKV